MKWGIVTLVAFLGASGAAGIDADAIQAFMDDANAQLAEAGASTRLVSFDVLSPPDDGGRRLGSPAKLKRERVYSTRTLQEDVVLNAANTGERWTRGDPRRYISPKGDDYLTWFWEDAKLPQIEGLSKKERKAKMESTLKGALQAWEDTTCPSDAGDTTRWKFDLLGDEKLAKSDKPESGNFYGIVEFVLEEGFGVEIKKGVSTKYSGDILFGGFVDWFSSNTTFLSDLSNSIAVQVGFGFEENGLISVDSDGFIEINKHEVYFNANLNEGKWVFDGAGPFGSPEDLACGICYDIKSVLMHEFGHSLGLAHYPDQTAMRAEDGTLFYEVPALMHALYTGPMEGPLASDVNSYCDIYQW